MATSRAASATTRRRAPPPAAAGDNPPAATLDCTPLGTLDSTLGSAELPDLSRDDVSLQGVLTSGRRTLGVLVGPVAPVAVPAVAAAIAVAVVAYPFLARAIVRMVAANRSVREADVAVEAALVATAAGTVLHVAVMGWSTTTISSPWADATAALPALLVALDIALLVVGVRSLRTAAARRGPLGIIHLGVVGLLAAHLLQVAPDGPRVAESEMAAAFALLAVGVAALHPSARVEAERAIGQPAPFSGVHAGVAVVAVLAAPGALAVLAFRGMVASATVAVGAALSGFVLAAYLIGLLRARASTEHRVTHDVLTGLPNRILLVDRLERAIAHARRSDENCAVLYVDIDRFKEVNDTFGHAAGDHVLKTTAQRLEDCVRSEDTVARLGGDEFVVLLPHHDGDEDVIVVADRILDTMSEAIGVGGDRLLVAGSVGIAVFPGDGNSAIELLENADSAMYRAKETPGNCWEVFSADLAARAHTRVLVEAGLLDGLDRDELVLHYQPIVELGSGRTVGAEALVRWNQPERGFLLPIDFVPIAEQSDLIVLLGEKVLFDVCEELEGWQRLGLGDRTIAVNVAARQFQRGLVETVTAALRATGARPEQLVIELTESTVVAEIDVVVAALDELRAIGVRAAIDDFGTGYCGLRYLSALPVAALKIDKSFIQGMTSNSTAIVSATIAMGRSLGLSLVAEGVETEAQRAFLSEQGCDRIQGYLVGRPMPADELVARLRAEDARSQPRLASVPSREAADAHPMTRQG